jgi:DNA-binding NtrC family response regulator
MNDLFTAPPKLLLVDDDPMIIRLLTRVIERSLAGEVEVASLSDPGAACRHLEQELVDIVVTDLEMPGVNGLEILGCAKRWNPCTQVLFVTGHTTLDALTEAMERGASDYLLKPLDHTEFLEVVREALKRCRRWRKALAWTLATRRRASHASAVLANAQGASS